MCVLRGLEAIGFDNHDAMVQQATEWLRMMQNSDGGWGESVGSYDDVNQKGVGVSTSSQTAWAVLGLMAGGDYRSESLARGIAYLLDHQQADGGWSEVPYTGTGFPRVFYLKYHAYPWYFPLMALAKYSRNQGALEPAGGSARPSSAAWKGCVCVFRREAIVKTFVTGATGFVGSHVARSAGRARSRPAPAGEGRQPPGKPRRTTRRSRHRRSDRSAIPAQGHGGLRSGLPSWPPTIASGFAIRGRCMPPTWMAPPP